MDSDWMASFFYCNSKFKWLVAHKWLGSRHLLFWKSLNRSNIFIIFELLFNGWILLYEKIDLCYLQYFPFTIFTRMKQPIGNATQKEMKINSLFCLFQFQSHSISWKTLPFSFRSFCQLNSVNLSEACKM